MSQSPVPPLSASDVPGLSLSDTIGALLLGGLVSAILYGITSTQTAIFYQRSHGDRLLVKLVVFILWVLDTFDMCLICHILYWYMVVNYGNILSLQNPIWSIILHVTVTSVTQTVVRSMFAWRVYRLSHSNWIATSCIAVVTILDLVCSIIITVKAFHTTFVGLQKLDVLVYLEFGSGFAGDTLVALFLCYCLHTSRTGIGRTESLINILMAYIVNTGLLTAMTSSVSLILFASRPNDLVYVAIYFQLSKLYVNAYLAMLNAREGLRERSRDVVSFHLSQLSTDRGISSLPSPSTLNPSSMPFSKASAVSSHHVDSLNDLSQDESIGIVFHSQTEPGLEFRDYRPKCLPTVIV